MPDNYSILEMLNLKDKNIKLFNNGFEKSIIKNEEAFIYRAYLNYKYFFLIIPTDWKRTNQIKYFRENAFRIQHSEHL